jgi:hypothetical protein
VALLEFEENWTALPPSRSETITIATVPSWNLVLNIFRKQVSQYLIYGPILTFIHGSQFLPYWQFGT